MAVGVEYSRVKGKLPRYVNIDVRIEITRPRGQRDQATTFHLRQCGPFSQDGAVRGDVIER